MAQYKVKVYRDKAGDYRFTRKGMNGEPVGNGEGYSSEGNVLRAVRSQFPDDEIEIVPPGEDNYDPPDSTEPGRD